MIIVTGMPRSGTSLMMRLMFYLDIPTCGRPFPKNRDKTANLNGYWEDMDILNGQFGEIDETGNFAVKVMLYKLIDKVTLNPTDHKVILCKRNMVDMVESQMRTGHKPSSTAERCTRHNTEQYGRFTSYIGDVPFLEVNLDNLKANKTVGVNAIKTFISGDRDITKATSIIN